jgi:hypothetical protein
MDRCQNTFKDALHIFRNYQQLQISIAYSMWQCLGIRQKKRRANGITRNRSIHCMIFSSKLNETKMQKIILNT